MEAPALGDVKQGRIYNCALASILGALAQTASGRKRIQGLVAEHKGIVETDLSDAGELDSPPSGNKIISDRYFTVSLGESSIEVSAVLYTDDADRNWSLIYMTSPTSVLWPCLIEKAFAAKVGGYANLDARKGLTANNIWETVVGSKPGGFEVTDETPPSTVIKAAKAADKIPTIAASRNDAPDVTGFHGYTMLGMRGSNIELHDPMAMKRISALAGEVREEFQGHPAREFLNVPEFRTLHTGVIRRFPIAVFHRGADEAESYSPSPRGRRCPAGADEGSRLRHRPRLKTSPMPGRLTLIRPYRPPSPAGRR